MGYKFKNNMLFELMKDKSVYGGRGIQTRLDEATLPCIMMYVVSTYCATETTETSQKKFK